MDYINELDKICKLPVTAKVLSRENYKSHLECHNYYRKDLSDKTNKEKAIKERNYWFSFHVIEKECIIYQTETMCCEQEWIAMKAKTTTAAIRKAVIEFYKRYYK